MSEAVKMAEAMRENAARIADAATEHDSPRLQGISRLIRALPLPEAAPDPRDEALVKARGFADRLAQMDPDGMCRETCAAIIDQAFALLSALDAAMEAK